GPATAKGDDPGFRGAYTDYAMWGVPGSSGSANLSGAGAHGHRVVGVTQGGPGEGGVYRSAVASTAFLERFEVDKNGVIDAVDYDWIMTRPVQRFYLLAFGTAFQRSRWMAV